VSKNEKQSYLSAIKERYLKSSKQEKSIILKEFCAVCGYNKKYAIRLLNAKNNKTKKQNKSGAKPKYNSELFISSLKTIWKNTDYLCSKRLKEVIPLWLPHYESFFEILPYNIKEQLLNISPASIDRVLKPARAVLKKVKSAGTKPGTLLKNQIPIKTDNWDVTSCGFVEADTVAHCGNSLSGDFIWSLTITDIHSGWTENRAVWNKGAIGVLEQIKDIEKYLPFSLKGFDCDNGSEFLNYHLLRYFTENGKGTAFTRSRPYKKNDNAHVEQKNWTQVRQLFGYDRLDEQSLVEIMNSLYSKEWSIYNNFFRPSQKLIEKTKINSKYYKKYDKPKTPLLRVMESKEVSEEKKEELKEIFKTQNPFELKKAIEDKLNKILTMTKLPLF